MLTQTSHSPMLRVVAAAIVLGLAVFISLRLTSQAAAADNASFIAEALPNSPQGIKGHVCTVTTVWADDQGIGTHCLPLDGPFGWYTMPATDSKTTARVLSLLMLAKATDRQVGIYYDIDDAANCADPSNCRRLTFVEIQ